MTFNDYKQQEEFLEAAKPLIKWLNDNCHPHCQVVVDHTSAILWEGVAVVKTKEFLRD